MDPFSTSKVIGYILNRLSIEKSSSSKDSELRKLLDKGENHLYSDHVRSFEREGKDKIVGLVDPSYGKTKTKTNPAIKSYVVQVLIHC